MSILGQTVSQKQSPYAHSGWDPECDDCAQMEVWPAVVRCGPTSECDVACCMLHTGILSTLYSGHGGCQCEGPRGPAHCGCPFYATQLCSFRENLVPCYLNRIKLPFTGTSPWPRDLAKHRLPPFAAYLCPLLCPCPHLLDITSDSLDLHFFSGHYFRWLGPCQHLC